MSTKLNVDTLVERLDQLTEDSIYNQQIPRMIYEIEMAKNRLVKIQLMLEQKEMIRQAASHITPANGNEKLPPPPGIHTR